MDYINNGREERWDISEYIYDLIDWFLKMIYE